MERENFSSKEGGKDMRGEASTYKSHHGKCARETPFLKLKETLERLTLLLR